MDREVVVFEGLFGWVFFQPEKEIHQNDWASISGFIVYISFNSWTFYFNVLLEA